MLFTISSIKACGHCQYVQRIVRTLDSGELTAGLYVRCSVNSVVSEWTGALIVVFRVFLLEVDAPQVLIGERAILTRLKIGEASRQRLVNNQNGN
jgi:hypothetical protein